MRMAALRPQVLKVRILKAATLKVQLLKVMLPMALCRQLDNWLNKALKQL
ncbi:MAG: hypothetical protein ISS52_05050 [Dehalococcoidia bacterium]|nr:hypothetical protein [Dehalococcoidia bacterium]